MAGVAFASDPSHEEEPDLDRVDLLARAFGALASTERLAILDAIRSSGDAGASVSRIADAVDLSRFATSYHLGVLRAAGLVQGARVGYSHMHTLVVEAFHLIDAWLLPYLAWDEP